MKSPHSFHIPVLGTGFTIDTPLKVAPFGISSVISLVDDELIEQMYKHYTQEIGEPYEPIRRSTHDSRAQRITRYLNLLDTLIQKRIKNIRKQDFTPNSELTKYFEWLPESSDEKQLYLLMRGTEDQKLQEKYQEKLRESVLAGSIDVNIMTKLDRAKYEHGEKNLEELPDAIAALKGFAESSLRSSLVLSAGVNAKLFQAVSTYEDFFPDKNLNRKKQIILKVSDVRSAITQGKMFAKKGIWVSEYRIESGLNCGGHAFPTQGELMGPILNEFLERKDELKEIFFALYCKAIEKRFGEAPSEIPEIRLSAQGGVGTGREQQFLLRHYGLDSIGWGTPFLLVPEATTVDPETRWRLSDATAQDVVLSDSSPLGVPFYTLRNSPSEENRKKQIEEGKPGSPCYNKHLVSNTEFSEEPLCVASQTYQKKKLAQLQTLDISETDRTQQQDAVLRKACICFDLGAGARLINESEVATKALHSAVCPGPSIEDFERVYSLRRIIDHIYGRADVLPAHSSRPHMFIKELMLYTDYLKNLIEDQTSEQTKTDKLQAFQQNLMNATTYYETLSSEMNEESKEAKAQFCTMLSKLKEQLEALPIEREPARQSA